MTLALNESQEAIRETAAQLFSRLVNPARIETVEATPDRFDRELWSVLANAGLLGVAVSEDAGGLGLGATEVALVLEELGRAVAPVPLVDTALAAWAIDVLGSPDQRATWLPRLVAGEGVAAVAVPPSTVGVQYADGQLAGTAVGVPWAHVADVIVLPVASELVLLDPRTSGVAAQREETTGRAIAATLEFNHVAVETLGDNSAAWLVARVYVALSAVQAGITDAAVRMTASYTSEREQFGKPLSTFQSVALKAADAYLDATVIRATVFEAAEAIDRGVDAALETLTAAWWAAEAGQHCVHLTQHLHGGMGADVTYPVHRYFLWAKQIELMLGGASALLADLSDALESRPEAGDAITL
jgi:3-oxocholest-4-en-26-oyl-CoA dehydrogenase beta subunit